MQPEQPDLSARTTAELHADLGDGPLAAGNARRVVHAALHRWHLQAMLDTLLLTVSELVTNAVQHGRAPVTLTLRRTTGELGVRVHDEDPAEPTTPESGIADQEAESGRGMGIVTALADDSGCEQVADDGKVVFATFRTPSPEGG